MIQYRFGAVREAGTEDILLTTGAASLVYPLAIASAHDRPERNSMTPSSRRHPSALLLINMIAGCLVLAVDCAPGPASTATAACLKNGVFYTVDASSSRAGPRPSKDGRFVYVGSDSGASAFIGKATKVVDLEGKLVLPGFIDGARIIKILPGISSS